MMEENGRNCRGAGGNGLPGPLLPVITGKSRYGSALTIKTGHGNILVSERREAGGAELFFHNLITQSVGMLH